MIKEYAIDPSCLADNSSIRFLYESLGFEHGRLVVKLIEQREWLLQALEMAETSRSFNRKLAEVMLNEINKYGFSPYPFEISPTATWLENLETYIKTRSLDGIVSDLHSPPYYSLGDLSSMIPEWQVNRGVELRRSYSDFFTALNPIVRNAKKIKIVDPYFDICEDRFANFLKCILNNLSKHWKTSIEIHVDSKDCRSFNNDCFRDKWIGLIEDFGRTINRFSVDVYVWREIRGRQTFHDRFLLTNIGGIRIPRGTDLTGRHDTAELSIMERHLSAKKYAYFSSDGNNPEMNLVSKLRLADK